MRVNYRELLKKYMTLIFDCDGSTFLLHADRDSFSEAELRVLTTLDDEVTRHLKS